MYIETRHGMQRIQPTVITPRICSLLTISKNNKKENKRYEIAWRYEKKRRENEKKHA